MKENQISIIGGGLAGLTAAIHLSKIGYSVTLIEKNSFPKHKVCGEYISNEVKPYLEYLGLNISDLKPTQITKLEFSTQNGTTIKSNLPLGGFGISRFALDELLYKKAISNGCEILQETVENISFEEDIFTIKTSNNTVLKSKIVVGAFGKRSNIDQNLSRKFIKKKAPWLAVKAHYSGIFPDDLVGLHNFEGGYCGISKVENNIINVCYLADYETFKRNKNIDEYQNQVLHLNPILKNFLENATLLFEKPLTISQISFEKKCAIENHILMIGDTAGLIHPLCGNGMAMAIHSAKIVSELIDKFYKKEIKTRLELENNYQKLWNLNFKNRLKIGRLLSQLFQKPKLSGLLIRMFTMFPFLLPILIKKTHGKTLTF